MYEGRVQSVVSFEISSKNDDMDYAGHFFKRSDDSMAKRADYC